jgi:CubicO group peptidase (beta-lactamase class C family)
MHTTTVRMLMAVVCAAAISGRASAASPAADRFAANLLGEWSGVRHLKAPHYSADQGVDLRIAQGPGGLEIVDLTRTASGMSPAPIKLDGWKFSAAWSAMSGQVGLTGELSPDGRTLRVRFIGEMDARREADSVALSRDNPDAKRFFEPLPESEHPYAYTVPPQMRDGWTTDSVRHAPINLELLEKMVQSVESQNRDPKGNETDGVVIAVGGKLVFEDYFWGYDRATPHEISSDTKSITSILAGIAADQNKISAKELVSTFFPDYSETPWVKDHYAISLGQIMSMTAGVDWNEDVPYQDPRNTAEGLLVAKDPIAYVLERRLVEKPGARFQYNSGLPNLVGDAISRRAGQPFGDFAEQFLFAPLGIKDHFWTTQKNGHVLAAGGLYLRPRDMAKIGQMMLDHGVWNGRRVLSEAWVDASTSQQTPADDYAYGYYWHLSTKEKPRLDGESGFMAIGQAGQYIVVIPRLKAVIAVTSSNWQPGGTPLVMSQIINKFIVPALQGVSEAKAP